MLRDKEEQGRDVTDLAEWLSRLPDDYQAVSDLAAAIDTAPMREDWPYVEPSDLDGIRAEQARPAEDPPAPLPPGAGERARAGFLGSVAGCILGKPVEVMPTLDELRDALRRLGEWPLRDYIPSRLCTDGGFRARMTQRGHPHPSRLPPPRRGPGKRYNLPTRAARNTGIAQALADLPPVLISDLIGTQPRTAERFAALAGENWSDYLAGRDPARTQGPAPTVADPALDAAHRVIGWYNLANRSCPALSPYLSFRDAKKRHSARHKQPGSVRLLVS